MIRSFFKFVVGCAALLFVGVLDGQIMDTPVDIPVDLTGRFYSDSFVDQGITYSGSVVVGFAGTTSTWASTGTGWIDASTISTARLKPGKTYLVSITPANSRACDLHFTPPAGMRVYLDDIERKKFTLGDVSTAATPNPYTLKVRVEFADRPFLAAGEATELRAGRFVWAVGLGRLKNGRSAGTISIRENDIFSGNFNLSSLICDHESSEIIKTSTQIFAPQCGVVLSNPAADQIMLKFYARTELYVDWTPGSSQYGKLQILGLPFVAYTITRNISSKILTVDRTYIDIGDYPTFISQATRHSTTELKLIATDQWRVMAWKDDSSSTDVLASYWTYSDGGLVETIEQKDPANTVATRTKKEYQDYAWGRELYRVTLGDGLAQPLVTTYDYYPDATQAGNYRNLKARTESSGAWVSYDYFDDLPRRGQIAHEFRPWVNAPTVPAQVPSMGKVVTYDYAADWTGKATRPALIATTVNGTTVAKTTTAYSESSSIASWQAMPIIIATRNDYSDATHYLTTIVKTYREDADPLNHDFPGLVHSTIGPDGIVIVTIRSSGIITSSSGFDPTNNGPDWRVTSWIGTTATQGTVAMAVSGSFDTDAQLHLVPGRSVCQSYSISADGTPSSKTNSIYIGTSWKDSSADVTQFLNGVWPSSASRIDLQTTQERPTANTNWSVGRMTKAINEIGNTWDYTYDIWGRANSEYLQGSGAVYATNTIFTYDGSGHVLSETTGSIETLVTTRSFDTAGRLTSEAKPGVTATTHAYDVAARSHTITLPTSGTRIEVGNADGRPASVTGTSVVSEYYTYGIEPDGRCWTQVNVGTVASPRWRKSWTDWLGRLLRMEKPGGSVTGTPVYFEENSYDPVTGLKVKTSRSGVRPTLFEYDLFSAVAKSGIDLDNTGTLADASADRITRVNRYFEIVPATGTINYLWLVEETYGYPTSGNAMSVLLSKVRRRLSEVGTAVSYDETTNADGLTLIHQTYLDRLAHTMSVAEDGPSIWNVVAYVCGLPVRRKKDSQEIIIGYDVLRRKVLENGPRSNDRTITAYKPGTVLPQKISDYSNEVSYTEYNSAGQITWTRNADGNRCYFNYNLRGQLLRQWGPATYPVEYGYDSIYGDRISQRTFRNPAWNFGTDTWPALNSTDGDATTWAYYAHSGFLWKKTDAANQYVERTYNDNGTPLSVAWARGVTATYGYDDTAAVASLTYSDGTPAIGYTYTRMGRMATATDDSGTHVFNYDSSSPWRMASEDLPVFYGGRRLTYLYEANTDLNGSFAGLTTPTLVGRDMGFDLGIPTNTARDMHQEWHYNSSHSVTAIRTRAGAGADQDFVYNYFSSPTPTSAGANQRTKLVGGYTTGTNFSVSYGYDSYRDLVISVESKWGATSVARYNYMYDAMRRRTTEKEGGSAYDDYLSGQTYDGIINVYGYDGRSELVTSAQYRGSMATTIPPPEDELPGRRFEYRYDQIGNRSTAGPTGSITNIDEKYTSNALNQYASKENNTVKVFGTSAPQAMVRIAGASAGVNRRDRVFAADFLPPNATSAARGTLAIRSALIGAGSSGSDLVQTQTRTWSIPPQLQNFTYDADGNLASDGMWDYAWDAENRLRSMQTTTVLANLGFPNQRLEFRYDYQHRRISKKFFTWNTVTSSWATNYETRFIYHGWNLIAEIDGSTDAIKRSYTWGIDIANSMTSSGGIGALLRIVDSVAGKTLLSTYDAKGNVTTLINNTTGGLEAIYEYSPFGELLRCSGDYAKENPFRFATKYWDDESGLVYHNRRYYSPSQGRFLGRDPIHEKGGLNLYGFCGNDGVNRYDVLGQYYTLEEKDGKITITVPIVFDGLVTVDDKANVMSIAQAAWGFGDKVDGKTVTITFVELDKIPENLEAYNLIQHKNLGEDARSTTNYNGADKHTVVTFNNTDIASQGLVAHEIGHVLGNTDHYSIVQLFPDGPRRVAANEYDPRYKIVKGSDAADAGWEVNTMGTRETARITADNIRETLRRPTSLRGPLRGPEDGWSSPSDPYDFGAYHSSPNYIYVGGGGVWDDAPRD